ncbi:hypothetical protein GGTG_01774 [Gaeumannomyces tritici R3-111a-1]|uniref:Uncharacterized protein n=1 Tax=Gaeumannomyces tritici (strain R3-111a-1) TaxID=644352 RepID=J3NKI3_GAET3|nr:hypothetical protein GGTG_01774 [Gaeumannomyces tritici R3-111a-1]EJT81800.1 hypothetical protein GGTG_01774 [Gaeumannomyces tritici R3-111a-1]
MCGAGFCTGAGPPALNAIGSERVLKFLLLNPGVSGLYERLPNECFLDMKDEDDYGVYLDDSGHNAFFYTSILFSPLREALSARAGGEAISGFGNHIEE